MNWIKQFINRCKAKTPKIFRKVQYVAGAISATMIAVNSQAMEYAIELPSWWNKIIPYVIGFSAGLVALSQFTQSYDSNGNPIYKS
jgi:hypothetical protein